MSAEVAPVSRLDAMLALLPDGWHESSVGRRAACEDDPQLFALVYLRQHVKLDDVGVTFSPVHLDWYDHMRRWMSGAPSRDVYIAPRAMGKSSSFFLIGPLWAAAYGYVKFVAAFADSATQAEGHLQSFRHELDTNPLLRQDFPELCAPATRQRGTTVSDNRGMLHTKSGFVFAARGVDAGTLGMKVGDVRPDLIVLDDVEPGAANYSAYQAEKRLSTITDVILPLNDQARVAMVGTVTMPGSIVHQAVKHAVEPARWVLDERFTVHHALPFDEAGESVWPERWSTAHLRSIQHTRSFALNFLNEPIPTDGDYWTPDDFTHGDLGAPVTRQVLSVDPAVTTKTTSDYTGLSVVAYAASTRRCAVLDAVAVKLAGEPLRDRVLRLLVAHPATRPLLVEVTQGGDLWQQVFHDMPVKVVVAKPSAKKEVRAAETLNHYQRGRVVHHERLRNGPLEQQMCAFPKAPNDDLVDSVGQAVNKLLAPPKRRTEPGGRSMVYA